MNEIKSYKCDRCSERISYAMWFNGTRIRGEALCIACQIVKNEETMPVKMYTIRNKEMIYKFQVSKKELDRSRSINN